MAVPTNQTRTALGNTLTQMLSAAAALKNFCTKANTLMASQTVSANQILQLRSRLYEAKNLFAGAASLTGLDSYAQTELNDVTLALSTELTAVNTAITNATDWIETNFPTSAAGYLLKDKFAADGGLTVRQFTPAQTAPLRTLLDAVVAGIE